MASESETAGKRYNWIRSIGNDVRASVEFAGLLKELLGDSPGSFHLARGTDVAHVYQPSRHRGRLPFLLQ
jgi:hypothetical protein